MGCVKNLTRHKISLMIIRTNLRSKGFGVRIEFRWSKLCAAAKILFDFLKLIYMCADSEPLRLKSALRNSRALSHAKIIYS